jgi:hypothetical protein
VVVNDGRNFERLQINSHTPETSNDGKTCETNQEEEKKK